jgi:hypothetical protein
MTSAAMRTVQNALSAAQDYLINGIPQPVSLKRVKNKIPAIHGLHPPMNIPPFTSSTCPVM